ncbi:MAG: RICIN domain-containing protein [Coriobacteriales bacterium]|jgi:hypothetical protein|nr:RICIN domain-containing protein [Coriobacteriales bacterium]
MSSKMQLSTSAEGVSTVRKRAGANEHGKHLWASDTEQCSLVRKRAGANGFGKALSVFLVFVLVVALLPTLVFAQQNAEDDAQHGLEQLSSGNESAVSYDDSDASQLDVALGGSQLSQPKTLGGSQLSQPTDSNTSAPQTAAQQNLPSESASSSEQVTSQDDLLDDLQDNLQNANGEQLAAAPIGADASANDISNGNASSDTSNSNKSSSSSDVSSAANAISDASTTSVTGANKKNANSTLVQSDAAAASMKAMSVYALDLSGEHFQFQVSMPTDGTFMLPVSANYGGNKAYDWDIDWGDGTPVENHQGVGSFDASIDHFYSASSTPYTIAIVPHQGTSTDAWFGAFGFNEFASGPNIGANKSKVTAIVSGFSPLMKRTAAQLTSQSAPADEWKSAFIECKSLTNIGPGFNDPAWNTTVFAADGFASDMFRSCTALTSISGFAMPQGFLTVGDLFCAKMFSQSGVGSTAGFNLPQNIIAVGNAFCALMFSNCIYFSSITPDFNLPQNIQTVKGKFAFEMFSMCFMFVPNGVVTMHDGFTLPQNIKSGDFTEFAAMMFFCCRDLVVGNGFSFPQITQQQLDAPNCFQSTLAGLEKPQTRKALDIINNPSSTPTVFPYTLAPAVACNAFNDPSNVNDDNSFLDITDIHGNWGGIPKPSTGGGGTGGGGSGSGGGSGTSDSTEAFVFTINSGANAEFKIPFYSLGSFTGVPVEIQWKSGDKYYDDTTERDLSFIQSPAGIYQANTDYIITIRPKSKTNEESWLGDFGFGIGDTDANSAANRAKLKSIDCAITPLMKRTYAQISGADAAPYAEWCLAFADCTSLTSIGAGFIDWGNITKSGAMFARGMFQGCTALTSINGFYLPQDITNADFQFAALMFRECTSLAVMGDSFNLPQNVTSTASASGIRGGFATQMFAGCKNLVIGNAFTFPYLSNEDFNGIGSGSYNQPSFAYAFYGVVAPQKRTAQSIINDPNAKAVFPYSYYPQDSDRGVFECGRSGVFSDWQEVHRNWGGRNDSWIVYDSNGDTSGIAPATQVYFSGYNTGAPISAGTSVTDFPLHYLGEKGDAPLAIFGYTSPSKSTFTFSGWATSSSATSAEYLPGDLWDTTKRGATVLYAVWTQDNPTVDVSDQAEFDGKVVTLSTMLSGTRNIDIPAHTTKSGVQVIIWDASLASNQRFRIASTSDGYYTFTSLSSGLLLDVQGSRMQDGTPVVQWPATGGDNQKWSITAINNDICTISPAKAPELAIDVKGATGANESALIVYKKHGAANQQWLLDDKEAVIPNGTYAIKALGAGNRGLNVSGSSLVKGADLLLWDYSGSDNQRYSFTYNAKTGYYVITVFGSGMALDVAAESFSNGAKIIQWPWQGGFNQQWAVVDTGEGDGAYYIASANSGSVLDAAGESIANGTAINQWIFHGGNNQRWVLQ